MSMGYPSFAADGREPVTGRRQRRAMRSIGLLNPKRDRRADHSALSDEISNGAPFFTAPPSHSGPHASC
jgi:hypothetical protein